MVPSLLEVEYLSFSHVLVHPNIPTILSLLSTALPGVLLGNSTQLSRTMKQAYPSDSVRRRNVESISSSNHISSSALDPSDDASISSKYTRPFHLKYIVTLAAHQLSTDLHVTNTSLSDTLEFQALLHNYLRVPADEVAISPLQNLTYYDKTETTEEARATPKVETRAQVDVKRVTDSVYENAPLKYNISWPRGGVHLKVANFKDLVVWNPQQEGQKLSDMEENGW